MKLDDFPKYHLANLPTPLEEAPRLAEAIGIERLLIKRDDNTGLALGGNKARKLEYLIAEAQSLGVDIVLACGGPQSNHVRMTAAAARKVGMECVIFLPRAGVPDEFEGNLLLDIILGAEMRFLPDIHFTELDRIMEAEKARLISQGRIPYVIPLGGSTALGSLGYVNAVKEMAEQLCDAGIESVDIVTALGTGGTLAGLMLGCHLYSSRSRAIGVSVLWKEEDIRSKVIEIVEKAAELTGSSRPDPGLLAVYDQYIGEAYAVPTPGGLEAVYLTARTEGIILDPVYTGKAMAGLIDLARKREIGRDRPILFLHTGGAPALFSQENLFHGEALRLSGTGSDMR